MRIARIVMHSDIRKMGQSNRKGGKAFCRHLRESYESDLSGYHARLREILGKCRELQADLVLLPACAVIHADPGQLEGVRSSASGLKWVATGCLDLPGVREFSEVWASGTRVHSFDNKKHVLYSIDGLKVVIAQ